VQLRWKRFKGLSRADLRGLSKFIVLRVSKEETELRGVMGCQSGALNTGAIAQLGERQTEEIIYDYVVNLQVPGSSPGRATCFLPFYRPFGHFFYALAT
jgi:hypothetical protein